MEILLATHNANKATEIRNLLPKKYSVSTLTDIQYHEEIIENGKTFEENAWIKAKTAYNISQLPTLADDSGLCIEALHGEPGIYSARYAGTGKSTDNIQKVVRELENKTPRTAYFISVLCFYDGLNSRFFEGRIYGTIIDNLKGDNGFGYDPIFVPEGYSNTFAELSPEEKNKISHRAKALQQWINYLNTSEE